MATSASSSSSAQKPHHYLNHLYTAGPTSAPPPTPSTQPSLSSTSDSSSAAADTLSRLLHRLPPNLSLPTRLSPRASPKSATTRPLPTLSLSSTSPSSDSSVFEHGYFQVTHHNITPQLAESAESDSRSLFELPLEEKLSSFPRDWPLGFNYNDDDDHQPGSFCLDGPSLDTISELKLSSLRELTRELEKLGLEVVERLASAVGFDNPLREGGGVEVGPKHNSLMWVCTSDGGDEARRMYPYVVGMQCQIRPSKWGLLSDSGSVTVEPQVGSVLVTLGDIAQVWSNGKLKKVRGRPTPVSDDDRSCLSMTLLITLPLESTVSPLLILDQCDHNNRENEAIKENNDHSSEEGSIIKDNVDERIEPSTSNIIINNDDSCKGEDDHGEEADHGRVFNSFSFEDYAWRVYHDDSRLLLKDPLDRYRLVD